MTLPADEFPAGYNLTALLDVRNVPATSLLKVTCAEESGTPVSLHIGEQNTRYSLQQLSQDQLFLSVDTSEFPAGCELQASINNAHSGDSQPFTLARIVRLPQIESFEKTTQTVQDGKRTYVLNGRNLEMIEKAGWDQLEPFPIATLPAPIQGQGQKQELQVTLPDPPPPHGQLYVWLRGEKGASATSLGPGT